ncbi:hypothetical protein hrd7_26770 [Leptolinea sp. HRD-7]|nr:hypothetical protein hrd7_26770 [Leptolinea sp. HRD-7]
MQYFIVNNKTNKNAIPLTLGVCDTFLSRLCGLMFKKSIPENGGLLFINPAEDRINSAIHMFFMRIDLAIVWADSNGVVVDKILAKQWKTLASPQKGAKYIIETHIDRFDDYNCGDLLEIAHETIK